VQRAPVVGSDGVATGELVHSGTGAKFTLQLASTPSGAARLRVLEPGKERYSPPGVLLPEADSAVAWASVTPTKGGVVLTPKAGGVKYTLTLAPFSLDVVRPFFVRSPC